MPKATHTKAAEAHEAAAKTHCMAAGLDVSGVPLAVETATLGGSGKIADVYRKLDIRTDAVLRAAPEVVRDIHG